MKNIKTVFGISIVVLLLTGCGMIGRQEEGNTYEEETIENEEGSISEGHEDGLEKEDVIEYTKEEELALSIPDHINKEDWELVLVNPSKRMPEGYNPSLVQVDNEQRIDERIEGKWQQWKQDALENGHRLFFASGYRTIDRQEFNYNSKINGYIEEGYSEDEAIRKTREYLTEPGHSEHHTGLALDIVDEEWIVSGKGLDPEYDTQESQQWVVSTMQDYGFILRYPKGKESITDIEYESWHFRYVGEDSAKFIKEHDLTLEEYIHLLEVKESLKE